VVLKVVMMIFTCGILTTALSILVIIANFSVIATCVYVNSTYKLSISMDMIVEI